eukprot:s4941_g2.t1
MNVLSPLNIGCPEWLLPTEKVPENFLEVPERLREKKRKWTDALAERAPSDWSVACLDVERPVESGWTGLRFETR